MYNLFIIFQKQNCKDQITNRKKVVLQELLKHTHLRQARDKSANMLQSLLPTFFLPKLKLEEEFDVELVTGTSQNWQFQIILETIPL